MSLDLNKLNSPYIIAEIGCNHNGDTELGLKMISEAKASGASAVKFQYFNSDNLFTDDYLSELDSGEVKLENVDSWRTEELGLNNIRDQISAFTNDQNQLLIFRNYCKEVGIDFGCTPVDQEGIKFLKEINSDFIKISSMDANNLDFISSCIDTNIAIIVSTGMASLQEIDEVYNTFLDHNFKNFSILHCVSIYPPKDEIVNLNFIKTLKNIYDCEIGYSDHSLGFSLPIAAVAMDCKVIEKHFTLDKNMPGWDHKVSADVKELEIICRESNKVFNSLGNRYKVLSDEEVKKKVKFRRSMVAVKDLPKGRLLEESDFTFKRPGSGISPGDSSFFLGKRLGRDVKSNKTIVQGDFE